MNKPAERAPKTPFSAKLARGCFLPIIAPLMLFSSCGWGVLLTKGAIMQLNPFSAMFMHERKIVNYTGETLRLTPIAWAFGDQNDLFIPPIYEKSLASRDRKDTVDARTPPGAALEFVFNSDDMGLLCFVVKTERGDLFEIDAPDNPRDDMAVELVEALRPISPAVRAAYERPPEPREWKVLAFFLIVPPVLLGMYVRYHYCPNVNRIDSTVCKLVGR